MPGDFHRTVGKWLALFFWEDFAILENMAAWTSTVLACVLLYAFPYACRWAIATHQLSIWGPCTLTVWGYRPSCLWVSHMSENLIFRLELLPVPSAPGRKQRAVPTPFHSSLYSGSGRSQPGLNSPVGLNSLHGYNSPLSFDYSSILRNIGQGGPALI